MLSTSKFKNSQQILYMLQLIALKEWNEELHERWEKGTWLWYSAPKETFD